MSTVVSRPLRLRPVQRLPRQTLRMQLAILYAGVFALLAAALLQATNLLLVRQTQHGAEVHQLTVGSAIIFVSAVLLALVVGWLIAGGFLRRLRTIMATARDISANNLHERLALSGPDDEFKELGRTLDDLFGRLDASFESQRHFVANASHELRTPLTAERSLLQVALADPDATVETWRSTGEELLQLGDQQERLIDALLTLASSEGGIEQWEPFDLAKLAESVVLGRRQEAEHRGIHVDATFTAAPALGDPSLIEILVANLVDNALRHNHADGRVEISTTTTAGRALLSVGNTGPVIPPGEIESLLRPFGRLGAERIRISDGHGLGLAIVYAIASAHGATLVTRARPGGGLEIEVTFVANGTN